MGTTPEPTGFRRDIVALHALSELMEKNPHLPRPTVTLDQNHLKETRNEIIWYVPTDYGISAPGYLDWDTRDAANKELRRVDLEDRIAALVKALGPDLEWEKNDPSVDTMTYSLRTVWHGCKVRIYTWREAVCEEVVVLETEREEEQPDPEVVEQLMADVPKVKVKVTDKITEWQCNERLAAVTAPKHVRTVEVIT